LTYVETDTFDKSDKKFPANRNSSTHLKSKSETANILVISGGDGYEDFRGIGNTPVGEIAGREDSTNHLLLWQV
jgi:Rho guanine nucleotide exchange factor 17